MEADSMHGTIKKSKKNKKLYSMEDWKKVTLDARKKNKNGTRHPCELNLLAYNHFYDFKGMKLIRNKNIDVNKKKVNWMEAKGSKVIKAEPHSLYYKDDPAEDYRKIDIRGMRRSRRGIQPLEVVFPATLPKAYTLLPISKAKYNDLQKLCQDNIIPERYWEWYENIPFTNAGKSGSESSDYE